MTKEKDRELRESKMLLDHTEMYLGILDTDGAPLIANAMPLKLPAHGKDITRLDG